MTHRVWPRTFLSISSESIEDIQSEILDSRQIGTYRALAPLTEP